VLIETEAWPEARTCFLKALELDPDLSEAHVNLGLLYYLLEDYALSEEAFLAAVRINREADVWDPIVFANLGDLYFTINDLDRSIKSYFIALDIDPELSGVRNRLGVTLRIKGDLAQAKEQFELAIDHGDAPVETHNHLAECLLFEGDIGSAVTEYRKAIQRSEHQDPKPMIALGEVFMRMERYEKAILLFRKAFTLGERSPRLLGFLSRLSERLGEHQEAVAYFRLLSDGGDQDPVALLESARRCAESDIEEIRDPQRALKITRELVQLTGGKHPGVLDVMASAYAALGDFERAAEAASRAIAALPKNNPLITALKNRLDGFLVHEK
jgi:tetratricopeptide (TPR) repeat protein